MSKLNLFGFASLRKLSTFEIYIVVINLNDVEMVVSPFYYIC